MSEQLVQKQTWSRAVRPIRLKNDVTVAENQEVQVSEDEAVEFCDKKFETQFPFSGERSESEFEKKYIVRAVRIDKPTQLKK